MPQCLTSKWFECPCHGSQYNQVGEKKGGPAPRGLDRWPLTVQDDRFIINTKGEPIQGSPIGTNTTGQEAEGLSRRFIRAYERAAGRPVDPVSLAWHQGVVCVRALVEVAGWVAAGTIDGRDGHPWVIAGDAFAARPRDLTGVAVTPR